MKNTMKLIGLIALTAIITFTTACKSNSSGTPESKLVVEATDGRLTITGIDAKYNGKYAAAVGDELMAMADAKSKGSEDVTVTLGTISGGSVTLKVWKKDEKGLINYKGNDKGVEFMIGIFKESTFDYSDDIDPIAGADSDVSADFTAGKATVSSITFVDF